VWCNIIISLNSQWFSWFSKHTGHWPTISYLSLSYKRSNYTSFIIIIIIIIIITQPAQRSRYSDYATDWMARGKNPGMGKNFSSSPKRPDPLLGPPSLLFNG
jgi:hypothetical protein